MFCFLCILFFMITACLGSPIAPQILGGSDADIADFPCIVSVERDEVGHYCGAVIVSANWALTTAYCAPDPVDATEYKVRSGSALRTNGSMHNVLQWLDHPLNGVATGVYDFALFQVDPPFEFGENVAPAVLPTLDQATPDGAEGLFAGWGTVNSTFAGSTDLLQFGTTTLYGEIPCIDYLGLDYYDSKLCTRDPNGEVALCYRDEGGPLVVNGTLFGIALWPGNCNDPLEVQLFARVARVRDWIDSTIAV